MKTSLLALCLDHKWNLNVACSESVSNGIYDLTKLV